MPLASDLQRMPRLTLPVVRRPRARRAGAGLLVAAVVALVVQLAPISGAAGVARADARPVPKAVFIVGPTNGLTDSNLANAEKMARQADDAGMDVRRVFFPHATWDNVLANIQGANLVVYMGHGYGWPSPYTKELTESRQNGMGLNSFDGSGKNQYTYYGANLLRANVVLAPNSIVFLNHLCYAAGNGEVGDGHSERGHRPPTCGQHRRRLAGVRSTGGPRLRWHQKLNYPPALMSTDTTIDDLFMTPAGGSPAGYIGWQTAASTPSGRPERSTTSTRTPAMATTAR